MKPVTQTRDSVARATIRGVSKHGLVDLVIDMLRQNAGDEHLDGAALAAAFVEAFKPIATARGERVPNPSAIEHRISVAHEKLRAAEKGSPA